MTKAPFNPAAWARENLFKTWKDTVLTVIFGGILLFLAFRALSFVLTKDWTIVEVNMRNFLVGPEIRGSDLWAPIIGLWVLVGSLGLLAGAFDRRQERDGAGTALNPLRPSDLGQLVVRALDRLWPLLLLVLAILFIANSAQGWMIAAVAAGIGLVARIIGLGLPDRAFGWVGGWMAFAPIFVVLMIKYGFGIDWTEWGGFLLVGFAGAAGIALSFPLGLLLALGRRSKLPALKALSIAYIEFFRGVPLVVFLFIGTLVIGLMLPVFPSKVVSAIIIFTLFTAAYIAEIVRGGLQSLPPGQEEAGKAVGLPAWRVTSFIVLPQAIRNVIPALVGQAISLWKDTSLLFIIGLAEPLRVATAVTRQPEFRGEGLITVTLLFAAIIYWVTSFTMSRESQRLERKLGVGER